MYKEAQYRTSKELSVPEMILITGSYGKLNCRELMRQILTEEGFQVKCTEAAASGIGSIESDNTDFILMTASFEELERVSACPDMVVITSISSYPLRKYRRYEELLEDIRSFVQKLKPGTRVIANYEYTFLRTAFMDTVTELEKRLFWQNGRLKEGVWISDDDQVLTSAGGKTTVLFSISDLLLQGDRNIPVYLAACTAADRYVRTESLKKACLMFTGHPLHFCCYRKERGIRLYMQLNTGLPSLAEAAFVGFRDRITIVTGYMEEPPENQSYQGYAQMLSAYARRLILFGKDRELIEYAVRKVGLRKAGELPLVMKKTGSQALKYSLDTAASREWILFVPLDSVPGLRYDPERSFWNEYTEL